MTQSQYKAVNFSEIQQGLAIKLASALMPCFFGGFFIVCLFPCLYVVWEFFGLCVASNLCDGNIKIK